MSVDPGLLAICKKLESGVEVADRKWMRKTYSSCWVASEAVEFLLSSGAAAKKKDAEKLCSKLQKSGMIAHVTAKTKKFKSGNTFWVFTHSDSSSSGSGTRGTVTRNPLSSMAQARKSSKMERDDDEPAPHTDRQKSRPPPPSGVSRTHSQRVIPPPPSVGRVPSKAEEDEMLDPFSVKSIARDFAKKLEHQSQTGDEDEKKAGDSSSSLSLFSLSEVKDIQNWMTEKGSEFIVEFVSCDGLNYLINCLSNVIGGSPSGNANGVDPLLLLAVLEIFQQVIDCQPNNDPSADSSSGLLNLHKPMPTMVELEAVLEVAATGHRMTVAQKAVADEDIDDVMSILDELDLDGIFEDEDPDGDADDTAGKGEDTGDIDIDAGDLDDLLGGMDDEEDAGGAEAEAEDEDDEEEEEVDPEVSAEFEEMYAFGLEVLADHPDMLQLIVECFDNTSLEVRIKVTQMLTVIAWIDSNGFDSVTQCLQNWSANKDHSTIFDEFIRAMYFEKSLKFRGYILRLINGILGSLTTLDDRVAARYSLYYLGFQNILDDMQYEFDVMKAAEKIPILEQSSTDLSKKKKGASDGGPVDETDDDAMMALVDGLDLIEKSTSDVGLNQETIEAMKKGDDILPVIGNQIELFVESKKDDDLHCMFDSFNMSDAQGMFDYLQQRSMLEGMHEPLIRVMSALVCVPLNRPDLLDMMSHLLLEAVFKTRKHEIAAMLAKSSKGASTTDASTLGVSAGIASKDHIESILEQIGEERTPTFDEMIALLEHYQEESGVLVKSGGSRKAAETIKQLQKENEELQKELEEMRRKNISLRKNLKQTTMLQMGTSMSSRPSSVSNAMLPRMSMLSSRVSGLDVLTQELSGAEKSSDASSVPAPIPEAEAASVPAPVPAAAPIPGTMGAPAPVPVPSVPVAAPIPAGGGPPVPIAGGAPVPVAVVGAPPIPGGPPIPMAGGPPIPGGGPPVPLAGGGPPIPGVGLTPLPGLTAVGGGGETKKKKPKVQPRVPMKNFHWSNIKNYKIKQKTIWKDIEDDSVELHLDSLEQHFKKPPKKKKAGKKGGKKGDSGSSSSSSVKKISLLDSKRAYNVSIGLSRMRMAPESLLAAILAMDDEELNLEKLTRLLSFTPTKEEQQMFKDYDRDPQLLEAPDKFFWTVRNVDNLAERLDLWKFEMEFEMLMNDQKKKLGIMQEMFDALCNNDDLKRFLAHILKTGNYLNGGTKNGQSWGFKLDTLNQLRSTKASMSDLNLLEYLIQRLKMDENETQILSFIDKFAVLPDVMRLDLELFEQEMNMIDTKLRDIHSKLDDDDHHATSTEEDSSSGISSDMFTKIMRVFYEDASELFNQVNQELRQRMDEFDQMCLAFNAKPKDRDELLVNLNDFYKDFTLEMDKYEKKQALIEKERRKAEAKKKAEAEGHHHGHSHRKKKRSKKDRSEKKLSQSKAKAVYNRIKEKRTALADSATGDSGGSLGISRKTRGMTMTQEVLMSLDEGRKSGLAGGKSKKKRKKHKKKDHRKAKKDGRKKQKSRKMREASEDPGSGSSLASPLHKSGAVSMPGMSKARPSRRDIFMKSHSRFNHSLGAVGRPKPRDSMLVRQRGMSKWRVMRPSLAKRGSRKGPLPRLPDSN